MFCSSSDFCQIICKQLNFDVDFEHVICVFVCVCECVYVALIVAAVIALLVIAGRQPDGEVAGRVVALWN